MKQMTQAGRDVGYKETQFKNEKKNTKQKLIKKFNFSKKIEWKQNENENITKFS